MQELGLLSILLSSEDSIIVLSQTACVLFINPAALSLYEWQYDDVIGKDLTVLLAKNQLPSPFPETLVFPCNQTITTKEETEVMFDNGKTILWKSRILSANKTVIHLIGKDITKIVRASDKIFELDSIIAQVPGNLYWFNDNGLCLGCNEVSSRMLGISRQNIIGKSIQFIQSMHSDAVLADKSMEDIVVRQYNEIIKTGTPLLNIDEVPFLDADSVMRNYIADKIPLYNKRGKVCGVIGISVDITKQKNLEKQLRIEKGLAESASKAKSVFIANMSHDLRTTIAGIMAMSNSIKQSSNYARTAPNGSDLSEVLDTLINVTDRDNKLLYNATNELLKFCNEILDIIKFGQEIVSQLKKPFHLSKLVKGIIQLLSPVAYSRRLRLYYICDPLLPKYVIGSASSLNRILLNLVSNALKFTNNGFVRVVLEPKIPPKLGYKPGSGFMLRITIEDSGIGIPEDKFETIFDNFSRLTDTCEENYKGYGLGLYAVKNYLNSMSGSIKVESEVGKGSSFTVTVPLTVADLDDVKKEKEKNRTKISNPIISSAIANAPQGIDPSKETASILIVEDNQLAAIGLQLILKEFRCTTDLATNAMQALNMIKNKMYHLIFMDIGMSGLSGIELTKKIRRMKDRISQVPIIALTGHASDSSHGKECISAGMQGVITKPGTPEEFERVLQQCIQCGKKSLIQ